MASNSAVVQTVGTVESGLGEPLEVEFSDSRTGLGRRFAMDQFTGGHLLHLAVAGCVFNDLFREARARGIHLTSVSVEAGGDFQGSPRESTGIDYWIEVEGKADDHQLQELVAYVDNIAEIPSVVRKGAEVQLRGADVRSVKG